MGTKPEPLGFGSGVSIHRRRHFGRFEAPRSAQCQCALGSRMPARKRYSAVVLIGLLSLSCAILVRRPCHRNPETDETREEVSGQKRTPRAQYAACHGCRGRDGLAGPIHDCWCDCWNIPAGGVARANAAAFLPPIRSALRQCVGG
jgi:hypothetical protein